MARLNGDLAHKEQQINSLESQLATVRLPPPTSLRSCTRLLHGQTPTYYPEFPLKSLAASELWRSSEPSHKSVVEGLNVFECAVSLARQWPA